VPPIEIEVVFALPDAKPSDPVMLVGPELRFEARVPPEASGLGYFIAARDFTLEQKVEPGAEGLRVGDALTRTVTLRATDASSMMLPITPFPAVDGLAVYPDPTRARDAGGERGEARQATRVDEATYLLETEGSYTLPAIERSWWDVSAGRLVEASVPPVSFTVAPNPDLAGEIALPEEPEEAAAVVSVEDEPPQWWRRWEVLAGLAILALLTWLAGRVGPTLRARREDAARRRRESEAAYFERLVAACRNHDAPRAMQALLAWVDRVTPEDLSPTVGRLLDERGDAALIQAVRALERTLYGSDDATSWRGDALARALEGLRGTRAATRPGAAAVLLSPLNPPPGLADQSHGL
jgi:hypothetical protein